MPVQQSEQSVDSGDARGKELPLLVVSLLKGVIYGEVNPRLWSLLLKMQSHVRDYVSLMNLELYIDEAEEYGFLRSKLQPEEQENEQVVPRLMNRKPLSFHASLLLALLRKKLVEFDATGAGTRLILEREEIVDLVRVFLPDGSNDVKLANRIDVQINKILEMGFLRRLKAESAREDTFEVQRIIKAFVDAQWLSEFDARLDAYQVHAKRLAGDELD